MTKVQISVDGKGLSVGAGRHTLTQLTAHRSVVTAVSRTAQGYGLRVFSPVYTPTVDALYTVYTYLLSQIHVFRILNPFPATEISTFVNVITSFSSQNFCKAHFS